MWLAVLFGGWLITSLLIAPLVGRFVSLHVRIRKEPATADTLVPNVKAAAAKTVRLMHRA